MPDRNVEFARIDAEARAVADDHMRAQAEGGPAEQDARRAVEQAHRPDWSDWRDDDDRDSCSCGYNGTAQECAHSRQAVEFVDCTCGHAIASHDAEGCFPACGCSRPGPAQAAETGGPTCRACYAATLTPAERERFHAEPVTSCVYLCPKHEAPLADALARLAPLMVERRTPPATTEAEQ